MTDWIMQKPMANIVQYGRRQKPANLPAPSSIFNKTNAENINPSHKPAVFDFCSVEDNKLTFGNEEESASGKRVKQERSGLSEMFSGAFMKAKPNAKSLKKKEDSLKENINQGTHVDIEFLIHHIDAHNAGIAKSCSSTHFCVFVPATYTKERSNVLTLWLNRLGFIKNGYGTLGLPNSETDSLYKLLKAHQTTVLAAKASASTPVSMRSKSSSSESLSNFDDVSIESNLTASNLEDADRRHRSDQKADRRRSASNPVLFIHTDINQNMQQGHPGSLQLLNPSTLGSGSNSNGSRRYLTFPRRRSADADDNSERGGESPAFDAFSPINNGNRSRSGSCRNRSVSPLEASLLESMKEKMNFGASSSSASASQDEGEDFAAITLYPTLSATNLFSTNKEAAQGLHSIEEDGEEEPATQREDDERSEAPTEIYDEEQDEDNLHDRMSCDDFAAAVSPPGGPTLESQSFFSPPASTSRPPNFDICDRPSFPPEQHHSHEKSFVEKSASLFGAAMRMPPLFSSMRGGRPSGGGGGGPQSFEDDDLGNLSDIRRVTRPMDDTFQRNDRAQKKIDAKQTKLNQLSRSKTEPTAYSYSATAVAEGTPVQDRNIHSQPNPQCMVFNTPQAVLHAKWEVTQGGSTRCIKFLLAKVQNISNAAQTHSSPCYEEQQTSFAAGISLGASGGLRAARPSSDADFFTMSGAHHRSSLLGPQSDELPEFAAGDHCPFNSLVSSRPSFGPDESARHSSSLLHPQGVSQQVECIATARKSLFKRVTSCNSSLASMANSSANTSSPPHFVMPSLSFQESPSMDPVVFDAETKRKVKEHKSASKQRRMSTAIGGRSKTNKKDKNKTTLDEVVVTKSLSSTFSPCAKAKSGTSTRSRRRQSTALQKTRLDDSVASIAPMTAVTEDDEEEDVLNETSDTVHVQYQDDEQVFDGIVLGGSYQHCFEDGAPVVCAPGASDKRITDLQLSSNNNLVLSMYLPKDRATKTVDLGREWQWRRVSPCGYLVCRGQIAAGMAGDDSFLNESVVRKAQSICYYYLAKHPSDWMVSSLHKPSRDQRSSLGGVTRLDSDVFCGEENLFNSSMAMDDDEGDHEMEVEEGLFRQDSHDTTPYNEAPSRHRALSKGLFLSDESMTVTEQIAEEEEVDGEEFCFTQLTQLDISESEQEDLAGENVMRAAGSMHCLNASLMSMVISYLVSPVQKTATAGKTTRKGRKASSSEEENLGQLQTVCKAWALGSYMLTAQRLSDFAAGRVTALNYEKWGKFVSQYSWGKYLSDGVCKSVYCVQGPSGSLEAVSIMDVDDLADRDMEGAVTQELQISILCSSLVSLNICPNLVQVYSMFQAEYSHPESLWNSGTARPTRPVSPTQVALPKKSALTKGNYQYIRMEFCSGGDAEGLVRKFSQLSLVHVRQFLFQMCYALYTCREQIALRHFDIKLLNFFVTAGVDALPGDYQGSAMTRGAVDMRVGFGQHVYGLTLNCDAMDLVKLADFGTSAVGHQCLGDPITLQQFTTLENTPPEFLICGSAARQCFSADTFSLGLCYLHLLTGFEPYEELLKDVRCPKYLTTRLQKIWRTDDAASAYHVVGEVLVSIEEAAEEQDQDGVDAGEAQRMTEVLYDTLYRFVVLFGAGGAQDVYAGNPVWTALCESLGLFGRPTGGRIAKGRQDCMDQYQHDAEQWSVRVGQHEKMKSLRLRLHALGDGAAQLLESMTHFDPSMRCSMNEALNSPIFASLRLDEAHHSKPSTRAGRTNAGAHKTSSASQGGDVRYMHYYRGSEEDQRACDDLPIV